MHQATASRQQSQGVVLIIALMLLVVLSLIAVTSIRGTSSVELSSNNTRSQALAMQSAEAALRWCEQAALNVMKAAPAGPDAGVPGIAPVAAPTDADAFDWMALDKWDGTSAAALITVLDEKLLNDPAVTGTFYKRMPECMAQYQMEAAPPALKRAVITARGFGPEVEAVDATRSAPRGSEVWLQSFIQLD